MKGVGSYNDWPYYASSSSNLSAFAQPFSVNPSTSNDVSHPIVDLAESADAVYSNDFAVRSHPSGCDFVSHPVTVFDSTPSTKAYVYSNLHTIDSTNTQTSQFNSVGLASKDPFAYDQYYNSIKTSLVEAQPYYPSYIPAPFHDGNFSVAHSHWPPSSVFTSFDGSSLNENVKRSSEIGYSAQTSGSWNQFAQFNQEKSKQVEIGASFYSKESNIVTGSLVEGNLMNQGCQDSKSLHKGEVLHGTNTMGWEKHSVPICTNQLDDKFSRWQNSKSMLIDCSGASIQGSPSVSLETHNETPLNLAADSGKDHSLYSDLCEKYLRQHDEPSWVDPESSAPMTGLVKDLNVGSDTTDRDLGINIFSNKKEPYLLPTSGNTGYFDASQLHMHLEWNDPAFSTTNAVLSDKNASKNDTDFVFKATCGFSNPHVSLNNLNLTLNTNDDVSSIEKSVDSVDHFNPAVDSPCWKGAPAAHYPPFEALEASNSEYLKITGECSGSNLQRAQGFLLNMDNNVKIPTKNSNKNQIHSESDHQEEFLVGSLRMFPVTNFASEVVNPDGALDAEPCQSKSNCESGLPYLDAISEMRENNLSSNKTTYDCKSNTGQQVIDENKFRSPKKHAGCRGCTAAGCNVNGCLVYGKSDAVEHALSSTSVEDAPSEITKSVEKVSTMKINVQILVDTMCNLSELLLVHCLDDTCELREQDHNVLKNVIANLNTCISKSAEQFIPAQECLFPQPGASKCARELPDLPQSSEQLIPAQECHFPQPGASRCARELPELLQNSSFERPKLTTVGPECTNVELKSPCVQEKKNCHFKSGEQHEKFADSFPIRGVAEMMKEDNMTKALKKILSDNFHDDKGAESQTSLYKNLWLEAEAALCSISYKARYNQMKNEMEKYSCKQRDNASGMEELSKLEVVPNISTSLKTSTKVNAGLNPDYFSHDLPALNAANIKQVSGSKLSLDLNKPNLLATEEKSSHILDISIQDSPVSNINKDAGDNESSIMGRFYVPKSWIDNSCISSSDLEDLSSTGASPALDNANKLASREMENQKQVIVTHGVPIPNKNKASDFDTSVMARFHMLQSRAESSSSICSDGKLLDGFKLPANTTDCRVVRTVSEGKGLDADMDPITRHHTSYTTLDKSNPMEFLLNLEDDQETQSRGTYGLGHVFPVYYSDGFSSEWEHVEEEELPGKNLEPELV